MTTPIIKFLVFGSVALATLQMSAHAARAGEARGHEVEVHHSLTTLAPVLPMDTEENPLLKEKSAPKEIQQRVPASMVVPQLQQPHRNTPYSGYDIPETMKKGSPD